ncbi:unnamed protein product [Arctogadus glacialis]
MGVVDRGIIPRRRRGLGVGSSISIVNSKNGELGEGNCESDSVDESTGWGWETVNGVDSQGCGEGNSESDSVDESTGWGWETGAGCGETERSSTVSSSVSCES